MSFLDSRLYREKVYAGVLGKVIGVTSGKPVEGWDSRRILEELGEVCGFVHERLNYPILCTDDDISGTFTFLRAIEDNGHSLDLTSRQIGQTWLNYLIEGKSALWWGGIGASTEHTAYLRLKSGVPAPESGSASLNGKRASEQIGGQIFIDGWAMVFPGEPERAADYARMAASVSHDGDALHGAAALAAKESLAFFETDIGALVDCALSVVDPDSILATIIRDVRDWSCRPGACWQTKLEEVDRKYGARIYGVGHVFPNHALIHLALWHGGGDFGRSLDIVNTCGWDTDCNAGNLGCLPGIRNGLEGIPRDLRQPLADRVHLPTADAGRGVSDCAAEAIAVVNAARVSRGLEPFRPSNGAKHSFCFSGSVQGYRSDECQVENPHGNSLEIGFPGGEAWVASPVFIPPNLPDMHGYELLASPRIYPGQRIQASVSGTPGLQAAISLAYYDRQDTPTLWSGPEIEVGALPICLEAQVPALDGQPVYEVGLRLTGKNQGTAFLHWLDWGGAPCCSLLKGQLGAMGRSMWVAACDDIQWRPCIDSTTMGIVQNNGRGLAILGCRDWADYRVEAAFKPLTGGKFGLAIRFQGLQRYAALWMDTNGTAKIGVFDGGWTPMAASSLKIAIDAPIRVAVDVHGDALAVRSDLLELVLKCPCLPASGAIAVLAKQTQVEVLSLSLNPSEGRLL